MSTSAPSSPVDLCNLALDHIGESPIESIELPVTDKEELMARWYDQVRRTLLREQMWNFAQKTKQIPRTGNGEGIYADLYALPNDCVRLNSLGEDVECPIKHFELTERAILASEGVALTIRYNRDITSVASFDPSFISVFALRLAIKVAFKLTKKRTIVADLQTLLKDEQPKANSVDGQERPPVRIQNSRMISARRTAYRPTGRHYDFDGIG